MTRVKSHTPRGHSAPRNGFVIALWCAPPPEETTLRRYREIASCGFNTVLVWFNDIPMNRKVIDLCKASGLKAWISDFRLWTLPEAPAGRFAHNIKELISDHAGHPGLGGYYLYHEPAASLFERLGIVNRFLLRHDPGRVPFIHLPSIDAGKTVWGMQCYDRYLADYIRKVKPALVSWGHFALMRRGERPDYFENLEWVRRHCLKAAIPFMQTVLATPHGVYRDPGEAGLRWQVYSSLCYGAMGIGYFTYGSPGPSARRFGQGLIDRQGKRTESYDRAQRINRRVLSMAPVLIRLRSIGVYHAPPLPRGTRTWSRESPIKRVRNGELVLGWFQDERNQDYLFVVNRSLRARVEASIELRTPARSVREVGSSSGKSLRFDSRGNVLFLPLEAGDGRLVRLVQRP